MLTFPSISAILSHCFILMLPRVSIQYSNCCFSISAGLSSFLDVLFSGGRCITVNDIFTVWTVDAHTEGSSGKEDNECTTSSIANIIDFP